MLRLKHFSHLLVIPSLFIAVQFFQVFLHQEVAGFTQDNFPNDE